MWVFVNGQPSATTRVINLVNSNYQTLIFFMTVGIFCMIGLGFVFLIRGRKGDNPRPWYFLILDGTNHISLPKLQVLAWTFLLAFGYTYYALMRWLVMGDGSIPDFPGSLLVLLGVTSGGALISMSQNNSDKNLEWTKTPNIKDIIYEGGQLSLSKLQLILFTIISMTLYITYLADQQLVFLGMPEVPTNLLLLMGISQGGAIAGKSVESTEANNMRNNAPASNPTEPSVQVAAPQPQNPAPVPPAAEQQPPSVAPVTEVPPAAEQQPPSEAPITEEPPTS